MRSQLLVCLSVLVLAACSPAGEPKAEAPPPLLAVSLSTADQLAAPEGSPITITPVEGALRLAGHVPGAASTNLTDGASLRITEQYEQAAANHLIRVTIRARSLDGALGYSAAYTTNDTGNSGWRDLPLTGEFADGTFEYQVPAPRRGADDFIGINPPEAGSVEVQSIRIDVLPGDALRE